MEDQCSELTKIECHRAEEPDDVFICCANTEERCLGAIRNFSGYKFKNSYIFYYEGGDSKQEDHLVEMERTLTSIGPVKKIATSEDDPLTGIDQICLYLRQLRLSASTSIITIDITALSRRHILLLLYHLDKFQLWQSIRLIYTEPRDYISNLYLPMSVGIKEIEMVPRFANFQSLDKPKLLLIFLGYEGDRATALFNNIEPNDTILAVPKPAYHQEWEGRTEEMNRNLIRLVGQDHLLYLHSLDPHVVEISLSKKLSDGPEKLLQEKNCCIVPLGTKPQTVGLYLFWRNNVGKFQILYAPPLYINEEFTSTGIGKTWLLLAPAKN